jgi:Mannose-6-phosphate isomerase
MDIFSYWAEFARIFMKMKKFSFYALYRKAGVPFVHAHKQNEEIYAILAGKGKAVIDGETVGLSAGDWLRVSPAAKRQFFASEEEAISYVCIQVKEGSLEGYTTDDAVM